MKTKKLFLQILQQAKGSHLACSRNDVVGGLAAVYMVVGMYDGVIALLAAQKLDGAVGDDLIGVHIDGGSGAALNRVHDEILMMLTGQNLVAGFHDGVGDLLVQQVNLAVCNSSSLFNISQAVDNLRMHIQSGDMEVLCSTQGLDAVIYVFRYVFGTDGILLNSVFSLVTHNNSPPENNEFLKSGYLRAFKFPC